jgi:hypothetical protein
MALHTDVVIRNYLRENGGGTTRQIAEALQLSPDRVLACLRSMVDVYIDRYIDNPDDKARRIVKYVPVYELAQIPSNCPHPEKE